jgi:hypothetical protein
MVFLYFLAQYETLSLFLFNLILIGKIVVGCFLLSFIILFFPGNCHNRKYGQYRQLYFFWGLNHN